MNILLITAIVCGSFSAGAMFGTWWRSVMHKADRDEVDEWNKRWGPRT